MTNVFLYESKENDVKVLAGVVKNVTIRPINGVRKAIVDLEDFSGGVWTIFFSNREADETHPYPVLLADRIDRAQVKPGVFLAVKGYFNLSTKKANGLDFKYAGVFNFKDSEGKETNIVVGKAMRPTWIEKTEKFTSNQFRLTMPITDKDGNTEWVYITFIDNDKYPLAEYTKKTYERYIAPKTISEMVVEGPGKDLLIKQVAVRCGALRENTGKNGRVFKEYRGVKIVVDPNTRTAVADTAPTENAVDASPTTPSDNATATTTATAETVAQNNISDAVQEVATDQPPFADPKGDGFMDIPEDLIDEMAWE